MTRTISISGPHQDDAAFKALEKAVADLLRGMLAEGTAVGVTASSYDSGRSPASLDLLAEAMKPATEPEAVDSED